MRRGGTRFDLASILNAKVVYTLPMLNEFTAVIKRDGEWFVAWSPEITGANGQGRDVKECHESLSAAIQLILEDRHVAPNSAR